MRPVAHIVSLGAAVALLAGTGAGCGRRFVAVEPRPGDLRGQWLVNESAEAVLGPDCPLVAHLRLKNELPRRVRMVTQVRPVIAGKPELKWKAYRKLPGTLEAGATWEGVWLLSGEMEPGRYTVASAGGEPLQATPGAVEVRSEKLPAPVRTQHHCVAARLTGEVDQVLEALTREIDAGLAPPSTYLQLAEMMEALGDRDAARRQYEAFAERVYGNEELPAWLRSRITGGAHE